jgi:arginyl-tRNA synthetase
MFSTDVLQAALRQALVDAGLPDIEPLLERPRQHEHGDWATNVALVLAKPAGKPPRQVAQAVVEHLGQLDGVAAIEIAGPGFINFRLTQGALTDVVRAAVTQGPNWGRSDAPKTSTVNVEFVSANPTGPLHVGHGRQAVVGDTIANLLETTGCAVTREYYVNDAGNQMVLFGQSVLAAAQGDDIPEHGYHGTYVAELADKLRAAQELDDAAEAAYRRMLAEIQRTLAGINVHHDVFFSERTLHESGLIKDVIARLRDAGHVYDAGGATWLRTTAFGDDKDRVLLRSDGQPTYFAADCAYLANKVERQFDRFVYVLGADHHGYVQRLKSIAIAEGVDPDRVEVIINQFVNLFRHGQAVRMSKRTGEMVTLDELIDEVGADATRYTFLRFSNDATIDFDIAEVVRQHRDNPVYYVQYSHARIAGIMRTAVERGVDPGTVEDANLNLLVHQTEHELSRRLSTYPEVVAYAAKGRAPHKIALYTEEIAEAFHKFYTECQVISDDAPLTQARYWLCVATRQTLVNALGLLGVNAPTQM